MMDYNPLPSHPDLGRKASKFNEERHAELVRSGRVSDGMARVIVELLGDLFRFIFSKLIRPWRR